MPVPGAPTLTLTVKGTTKISVFIDFNPDTLDFEIKRAAVTGGPYSSVVSGLTTLPFLNTALAVNTQFFYVGLARNASGDSAQSAEVTATTRASDDPIPVRIRNDMKELVQSMTIAGGFNFDWGTYNQKDLAKATFPCVKEAVTDPEEENVDDEEGVDAQVYQNERIFRLRVVNKISGGLADNPKDAIVDVNEKMLDDLKEIFGKNPNLKDDSGAHSIRFQGMQPVDHHSGDVEKPWHMDTFWKVRYFQDRLDPRQIGC